MPFTELTKRCLLINLMMFMILRFPHALSPPHKYLTISKY